MLLRFHVDEIDHDQAAQIAQAQLTSNLFSGFHVGIERGGFNVAALSGARRVDVHRNQRFGVVNHDSTARWEIDRTAKRTFDLMLDLEA